LFDPLSKIGPAITALRRISEAKKDTPGAA
jgi:hypothetical protein